MGGGREAEAQSPAEAYEDFLVRWQFRPWTPVLLAEADLRSGERVLDLAAGTGVVARAAAPFVGAGGRVVAVDRNAEMLAVGRARPAPAGAVIEWREGDATQLPLPPAAFDAVLCQQGLQYFPDQPAALAEVRRLLDRPGRAVAAVWRSLQHNPVHAAVNAAALRLTGVAPLATAFGLVDADELRRLFADAGFSGVAVVPHDLVVVFPSRPTFVRRTVQSLAQVAPELADLDDEERAELARGIDGEADRALRSQAWGAGIAAPMAAHLVRAHPV